MSSKKLFWENVLPRSTVYVSWDSYNRTHIRKLKRNSSHATYHRILERYARMMTSYTDTEVTPTKRIVELHTF